LRNISQSNLFLSYLPLRSSLPFSSNPTMLFFLHLRDVLRRPSWPAESRTNLRAPPRRDPTRATFVGLSPDLPGDTGLTGTTWRRCKELLCVLFGPEKVPKNW
jgi:hypothetical protein